MTEETIFAVAAHTEELANNILANGRNVLYCTENGVFLLDIPTKKKIYIGNNELCSLFYDLDLVEYHPEKGVHKIFECGSSENTIILSDRCNSSCIMCPYSDNHRRKAIPADSQYIMDMIDYTLFYPDHLTLTGGEPTTIGDGIFDILALLKAKFPDTEYLFLTNGRVFSDPQYFDRFMSVVPEDVCLGIPIYGDSPQTHDYITRASGSFIETVCGIQKLMNADMKVELRIVVSKLNYNNLANIARFICKYLHRAFVVNIVGLEMCGNAARNRNDVWIDYPEMFSYAKEAIDILYHSGIDVGIYNFPLCSVEEKYRYLCKKSISSYKIVYDDKCDECSLRELCGGFFKTTYMLAKPEVFPVK